LLPTSLLPPTNISAINAHHHHVDSPPAHFDRRIAANYEHNQAALITADTPILSLCGGATDLTVPGVLLPSISETMLSHTVFLSRQRIMKNTCATAIAITWRKQ
jgi:GPI inositol-deacylase